METRTLLATFACIALLVVPLRLVVAPRFRRWPSRTRRRVWAGWLGFALVTQTVGAIAAAASGSTAETSGFLVLVAVFATIYLIEMANLRRHEARRS